MKISFLQLCIIIILLIIFFGNFKKNLIFKNIKINEIFEKLKSTINNMNLNNTTK